MTENKPSDKIGRDFSEEEGISSILRCESKIAIESGATYNVLFVADF